MRLGLDFSHFEIDVPAVDTPYVPKPDLKHLREAGPSIAAAWFTFWETRCCSQLNRPSSTLSCRFTEP